MTTNASPNSAINSGNPKIIPLDEGWNDQIKAKVRTERMRARIAFFSFPLFCLCVSLVLTLFFLFFRHFSFVAISQWQLFTYHDDLLVWLGHWPTASHARWRHEGGPDQHVWTERICYHLHVRTSSNTIEMLIMMLFGLYFSRKKSLLVYLCLSLTHTPFRLVLFFIWRSQSLPTPI
jgi:hypothetical protein